ncbi:hypothetical protein ACFRI7_32140 [Streptomyces sp. NPDC056716]
MSPTSRTPRRKRLACCSFLLFSSLIPLLLGTQLGAWQSGRSTEASALR